MCQSETACETTQPRTALSQHHCEFEDRGCDTLHAGRYGGASRHGWTRLPTGFSSSFSTANSHSGGEMQSLGVASSTRFVLSASYSFMCRGACADGCLIFVRASFVFGSFSSCSTIILGTVSLSLSSESICQEDPTLQCVTPCFRIQFELQTRVHTHIHTHTHAHSLTLSHCIHTHTHTHTRVIGTIIIIIIITPTHMHTHTHLIVRSSLFFFFSSSSSSSFVFLFVFLFFASLR
jgi:hypothetical protein